MGWEVGGDSGGMSRQGPKRMGAINGGVPSLIFYLYRGGCGMKELKATGIELPVCLSSPPSWISHKTHETHIWYF